MTILNIEPAIPLSTSGLEFNFIILGAGGTGSELIPKICRQLSFIKDEVGHYKHSIIIADGDTVEEKNLLRQNFHLQDLGSNKAEVMSFKCSTVFGMPVGFIPQYVENKDMLLSLMRSSNKIPFIIGCVDTNAVRKMIHETFIEDSNRMFYVDCGNEEFSGQVALAVRYPGKRKISLTSDAMVTVGNGSYVLEQQTYIYSLPDVTYHYPDMLSSPAIFASQESCAERAMSNPQAADANVEAACIAYQMVSNCLRGAIDYHMVTFNTLKGNRRTFFTTESMLNEYYKVNTYIPEANKVSSSKKIPPVFEFKVREETAEATSDDRIAAQTLTVSPALTLLEAIARDAATRGRTPIPVEPPAEPIFVTMGHDVTQQEAIRLDPYTEQLTDIFEVADTTF